MNDTPPGAWAFISALCAKLWPGLVGALFAMKFQPDGASLLDRAFAGVSSVLLSGIFGPALIEVFDVRTSAMQACVNALVAIFGLIVIGEVVKAIREVGFSGFLRDWMRRIFGVGGNDGGPPK